MKTKLFSPKVVREECSAIGVRFCWFPKITGDGALVWLEYVEVARKYDIRPGEGFLGEPDVRIVDECVFSLDE